MVSVMTALHKYHKNTENKNTQKAITSSCRKDSLLPSTSILCNSSNLPKPTPLSTKFQSTVSKTVLQSSSLSDNFPQVTTNFSNRKLYFSSNNFYELEVKIFDFKFMWHLALPESICGQGVASANNDTQKSGSDTDNYWQVPQNLNFEPNNFFTTKAKKSHKEHNKQSFVRLCGYKSHTLVEQDFKSSL
jgi:hypothetical protein